MVFSGQTDSYNGSVAVFSDDGGTTWDWTGSLHRRNLDESSIVQVQNGSLFAIMRTTHHHPHSRNTLFEYAISDDGGDRFGPYKLHPDLVTPVCEGALFAHESGALLFSGPYSQTSRENMTVLASVNNGRSFTRSLSVTTGLSGYSALQCGLPGREDCAILYDGMGESCTGISHNCSAGLMFNRFAFADLKPYKSDDAWPPGGVEPA